VIGGRAHLPIANDGPLECRLLGPAAEAHPRSDAAPLAARCVSARDSGFVEALQPQAARISIRSTNRDEAWRRYAPVGKHGSGTETIGAAVNAALLTALVFQEADLQRLANSWQSLRGVGFALALVRQPFENRFIGGTGIGTKGWQSGVQMVTHN
jgi:hypothetical protein